MKTAGRFAFTVLTPVHDQAHLVEGVYRSLCRQSLRDFEWIVVDDGSTDGLATKVRVWGQEADFPVTCVAQPNRGKHVAVNRGVERARGELLLVADATDRLMPDALERLQLHWNRIPPEARAGFSGIAGLSASPEGEVRGTPFPADVLDTNTVEREARYGVTGNKIGANRTDVLRCFPYPEDLGRWVPESLVWNRIGRHYRCRYVNEVMAVTEHKNRQFAEEDVYRSCVRRAESSRAARLYYQELADLWPGLPLRFALRSHANYVRYSLHGGMSLRRCLDGTPSRWLRACALLPGYALYRRDRRWIASFHRRRSPLARDLVQEG